MKTLSISGFDFSLHKGQDRPGKEPNVGLFLFFLSSEYLVLAEPQYGSILPEALSCVHQTGARVHL